MPLVVNGVMVDKLSSDTISLFEMYPSVKEYSRTFLNQPRKTITSYGSLYVLQREFALVNPSDPYVNILGTDAATTCNMVVLRHPETGMTACGHFDGSGTEDCIREMIRKVHNSGTSIDIHSGLELHMIGGFIDANGYSKDLCQKILCSFHRQAISIHLITACICEVNNTVRGGVNLPIVRGIAVYVKTGEIFPASFVDKGPDVPLRSSRLLTSGSPGMLEIYDSYNGFMKIGPFNYQPVRGIDLWLAGGDDLILKHLSTSPEAEDANFVNETRRTLTFIRDNPFPSITVFPEEKPRYYAKDEYGNWVLVTHNSYYSPDTFHLKSKNFASNQLKP
ncbi:N-terminal amidohydrolase 1 [Brevipalpus obovatus]|uniref:N-terminal amidohydrolase 1 n=1 Tax=Brevipalpus obovatus TaxID=246614 RepID=UPI003D9DBE1F